MDEQKESKQYFDWLSTQTEPVDLSDAWDARARIAEQREAELAEALRDVVSAVCPPRQVFMGSAHNRYEVGFAAHKDDPFKRARAILAKYEQTSPGGD